MNKEYIQKLVLNKELIIHQKKAALKHADGVGGVYKVFEKEGSDKAIDLSTTDISKLDKIKVKSVINTTNILDSHGDVHMKGIWKKNLKENKSRYLLDSHKRNFDDVISDKVTASTELINWSDMGLKYEGETEALVFESEISKEDHPAMFDRYLKSKVKEHSVGMQYVKISLAVNDKRYREEFEVWEKYINEIANKEDAEEQGFFWAVTEAKAMEGSAVLFGSNSATPTINIEAVKDTSEEPPNGTQTKTSVLSYLSNNF